MNSSVIHLKRFIFLFAMFIGLLGLLPHALFSFDLGQWHYIANAWDEDSYTIFTLAQKLPVYRLLSGEVLNFFYRRWGLDAALILMDVVVPMITAALAALMAYHAEFRTRSSLFIASCLLLFALAFMTLCSAALIGVPLTQLLPFSSQFYPEWIRMFVPNLFENFLNLYKTPEPQISMAVQFATLLCLLRYAQTKNMRYVAILAIVSLCYPFIYITTGIALIICIGCYGVLAWWTSRNCRDLWLIVVAAAASIFGFIFYMQQPPASSASVFLYQSRLPVMSPSLVWAVVIAWPLVHQWGRSFVNASQRSSIPAPALLAAACCMIPLITLNQQIVTGLMIQSRTWDLYTNMPFVAFALLLAWPCLKARCESLIPRRIQHFSPCRRTIAVVLAAWLCMAQLYVYHYYRPSNLDNLASATALKPLRAEYPHATLMLESMGDDSQVALRLGDISVESIAGYRQIMKHFAAPLSAGNDAHAASIAVIKEQAFAYFDRQGLKPDELEKRMREEAFKANAGAHIIYFFAMLDCWRAASDHRQENIAGMLKKIPELVADYRRFLNNPKRRMQFGEILYVTRNQRTPRTDTPWKESLAGSMRLGSWAPITVYVYHQR